MAENKEGQEKTELATQKRLHEARMRGQVAKSTELTTAAIMLIGGTLVFVLGKPLVDNFKVFMKTVLKQASSLEINFDNVNHYYMVLIAFLAKVLLPIMLSILIIILAAEIAQVGLKIADKKFTEGLNFKQIFNPFSGMKKIFFSGRSFFELIKNFLKLLVLGMVAYQVLASRTEDTISLMQKDIGAFGLLMVEISFELIVKIGVVYIAIAFADFLYQKHKFKEDMKMTKQEVKDEKRQTEGDPKIRARIRQLMRGRIRKLMLQNVSKADVVITNPTHFAVALSYETSNMNAPKVVAKGVDFLALQIRDLAKKSNVPIIENPPLARTLFFNVEVDQEIPDTMFKAVAQILAYVYNLKDKVA